MDGQSVEGKEQISALITAKRSQGASFVLVLNDPPPSKAAPMAANKEKDALEKPKPEESAAGVNERVAEWEARAASASIDQGGGSKPPAQDVVAPPPLEGEVLCWSRTKWVMKAVTLEGGGLSFHKRGRQSSSQCLCFGRASSAPRFRQLRVSSKSAVLASDDIETLPPQEIDAELILAVQLDTYAEQSATNNMCFLRLKDARERMRWQAHVEQTRQAYSFPIGVTATATAMAMQKGGGSNGGGGGMQSGFTADTVRELERLSGLTVRPRAVKRPVAIGVQALYSRR